MSATVCGKTLLVTGAGGYIGSGLVKAVCGSDPRLLILLDHSERNLHEVLTELSRTRQCPSCLPVLGDVSDPALLAEILEKYPPDLILHAAAFKHVPLMEVNPLAVIRNNASGTAVLVKAAAEYQVPQLVMISTDKAVNSRSVMGVSKRIAEIALLRWSSATCRMSAVRLGNVMGSTGSVIPLFEQQISQGLPLTVTHPDVTRYFLTLEDAVESILSASTLKETGAIYIPELKEPVRIVDLARRLIDASAGYVGKDVPISFTGLRPGEKMTEEFVSEGESVEPSADRKLRRVRSPAISPSMFDTAMAELEKSLQHRNFPALLEVLCRMVPEYRPSESLLGLLERSPV